MKFRLLAIPFCIAMLLPLAGHAGEGLASCRFANQEVRKRTDIRSDAWSAGLTALDHGDVPAAQSSFDRALAERSDNPFLIAFIARFYREGICGMAKDFDKAVGIYRDGAARGAGGAMLELALMLWHGQGVVEDKISAVHLVRQGALDLGFVGGKADVAELSELVGGSIPPELAGELDWVKTFVDTPGMGRAVADTFLSQTPPDVVSACRYMAFSFEAQPDPETAFRLGEMHLEGRGIEPSTVHGYRYLSRAASARHADATAEIGRRMLRGEIPSAQDWNALAWLLRASNMGANVASDVRAAKLRVSDVAVREAEMQTHFLPPLALPSLNREKPCQPKDR